MTKLEKLKQAKEEAELLFLNTLKDNNAVEFEAWVKAVDKHWEEWWVVHGEKHDKA